jgi:hypothetical protein
VIIAVDPGKNTGWCLYDHGGDGFVIIQQDVDQQQVCDSIFSTLKMYDVSAIVCESYTVTGSRVVKFQPYSLEIIGFLRWLAAHEGIDFVLQKPGDAKKIGSDDRIKKWGEWFSSRPHANDAQRHAFLYAVRQGWVNPLEVDARAG